VDKQQARFEVPDARYIRVELPVSEVAQKLGLAVRRRWARCPEDQGHWARIWMKANRLKCFTCPTRPLTTIDLVMKVLGIDVNQAIKWIAARFTVPMRRVRLTTNRRGNTKHLYVDYPSCDRPTRLHPSVDLLRRAPAYARLTPTARRLAAFLIERIPRESMTGSFSYRELQAQTHTGNRGTLARAFEQLRTVGLVQTAREASQAEGFNFYAARTLVRLTWGSPRFQESLSGGSATKSNGSELNHDAGKELNHEADAATRQKSEPRKEPDKAMKTKPQFADEKGRFGEFERAVRELASEGMTDFHQISFAACYRAHDAGEEFPFNALGAVKSILHAGARLQ
jgi:hypothetical protein